MRCCWGGGDLSDEVDRAGSSVDPVDDHSDATAEQAGLLHRDLDREAGEIWIDENDHVSSTCSCVAVERAALRVGVDRHLELLASTVRFKQVDDRSAPLASDSGSCSGGDVESHVDQNPEAPFRIPDGWEPASTALSIATGRCPPSLIGGSMIKRLTRCTGCTSTSMSGSANQIGVTLNP